MGEARVQLLSSRRPVPLGGFHLHFSPGASLLGPLCRPSLGAPALSCYLGLACGTHTHTHTHTHTPLRFIPGDICGSCRKTNHLQTPRTASLREGDPHLSFPVESTSGWGGPVGLDRWGAAGRLKGLWLWSWLCCRLQGRPSHPGSSITG